jgi:hypothetical protein
MLNSFEDEPDAEKRSDKINGDIGETAPYEKTKDQR